MKIWQFANHSPELQISVYTAVNLIETISKNKRMVPMKLKDLHDVPHKQKKVLLYADFNVPIIDGKIVDTFRIEKTWPTIVHILSRESELLVIVSHLGRPDAHEKECFKEGMSGLKNTLQPVYEWLSLRMSIAFARDLDGLGEKKGAVLLENTRLYDKAYLIQELSFVDLVVFDGFSVAHRPLLIPRDKKVYAGLLMRAELQRRVNDFDLVIMGGKKITDKMALIKHLSFKNIFFGGGMSFSILKQKNVPIGSSFHEDIDYQELLSSHDEQTFTLPNDFLVRKGDEYKVVDKIDNGWMGVDIGPGSIKALKKLIESSKCIFWNGPIGMFEDEECANGTMRLVKLLESAEKNGKYVLVGGGETAYAARMFGQLENVSTGGGALLSYMEGVDMPGLDVLEREH